jgi:hypothetical protein
MFCPADANTGLIQLVGPIAASDLKKMINAQAPLSIKAEPRSTPPSLSGNHIVESPNNTCTYNAQKFNLENIQIVSSVHTGYNLPGNTDTPVAELILSFVAKSPPSSHKQLSGILLCLPIYDSSSTSHDAYLKQIFENDPTKPNNTTLESLFYSSDTERRQTSLGYRTCFETSDRKGAIESHSIYVLVFPQGIRLASASYRMPRNALPTYQLPSGIRGNNATVRKYTIDDNGQKIATQIDDSGIIYTMPVSTCSDEFKNGRFEYFTFPPKLSLAASMASSRNCTVTEGFKNVSPVPDTLPVAPPKTCPTVKQYKCMPFDQLRDVHGDYVKMSDGTCLDDIIKDGKTPSSDSTSSSDSSSDSSSSSLSSPNHPSSGLSVAEMEEIVGGVLAGTLVLIAVIWGVSKFSNSN